MRRLLIGAFICLWSAAAQAQGFTGGAAVGYRIPASAPKGEVEVLSLGAADLPVPNLLGSERFVHVRVAAANKDDEQPWVLDARDQSFALTVKGAGIAPRYALAGEKESEPRLVLKKGERGALDLFFAAKNRDPEALAVRWRVRRGTSGEAIAGTTVFEQLPEPTALDGGYQYAHYWPSQFVGGWLMCGDLWSWPAWPLTGWLGHYRQAGEYGYTPIKDGGFRVSQGDRSWTYRPASVGSSWRQGGPSGWHKSEGAGPQVATPPPANGGWVSTGTPPTRSRDGWISTGTPPTRSAGGWISTPAPVTVAPQPAPTHWNVLIHAAPGDRFDRGNAAFNAGISGPRYQFDSPPTMVTPSAPSSSSHAANSSNSSTSASSSSNSAPSSPASAPSSVGGSWRSH